jgi:hypothetical protein
MDFDVSFCGTIDISEKISKDRIYDLLFLFVTESQHSDWLIKWHAKDAYNLAKISPTDNTIVFVIPPQNGPNYTISNDMVFAFERRAIESGLTSFALNHPKRFFAFIHGKEDVTTAELFWKCVKGVSRC